jgi:DNA-binding transcriptional ArsR family regulator
LVGVRMCEGRDGADSNGTDRPDGSDPDDEPDAGSPATRRRSDGGLPALDRYFDALSDRRRRYALYELQRSGSVSEEELARRIAARETGRPADDLAAEDYRRVQSDLHHDHLPRLADYGLVAFDPRSEAVRYEDPPRTFAVLLWLSYLVEGEGRAQ